MCSICYGYGTRNCPVCKIEVEEIICPYCEGAGHLFHDSNHDYDVEIVDKVYKNLTDSQKSFFDKINCEICEGMEWVEKDKDLDEVNYDDAIRDIDDVRLQYIKPATLEYNLSDLEYFEKEIS